MSLRNAAEAISAVFRGGGVGGGGDLHVNWSVMFVSWHGYALFQLLDKQTTVKAEGTVMIMKLMFYLRKKIKPDMRRSGKERGLFSRTAAGNRAYGYLTIIP